MVEHQSAGLRHKHSARQGRVSAGSREGFRSFFRAGIWRGDAL